MRKPHWLIPFFTCFLAACDTSTDKPAQDAVQLTPLSPYTYEFSNNDGKIRIDYFFINSELKNNEQFRDELYNLVADKKPKNLDSYAFYSLYVYEKNEQLNESFAGNPEILQGQFDSYLISYSRWNKGKLDLFYLIEGGNVVFDMLEGGAVSPEFEFD